MSKTRRLPFMGREIELRIVPVGVMLDAADMINEGKPIMDASFFTLCASAHWCDTGERAFRDRAACRATPGDHLSELMALVRECSELNRPDFGQLAGPAAQDDEAIVSANGAAGPPAVDAPLVPSL